MPDPFDVHPAWLPVDAFRPVGSARTLVIGDGPLVDTVVAEVTDACARFGGQVRRDPGDGADHGPYDLILAVADPAPALSVGAGPSPHVAVLAEARSAAAAADPLGEEGYLLVRRGGTTVVLAGGPAGLLYGLFGVVRAGAAAFGADRPVEWHRPALRRRVLNHWDNVDVHPVMGQVELGYAGGSLFWRDGSARELTRVRAYARLLASCGINAVSVNNVNVHRTEAHL